MPPAAVHHPLFARLLSVMSRHEPAEIRRHRDELLAGLSGRVIEVGAGTGSNFAHYPATVDEVVAVEPEPYLRERARAAATNAEVRIEVVDVSPTTCPPKTRRSTPPSPAWSCARCRTRRTRSRSCGGCCAPAASCASTSTCARTGRPSR